MSFFSQVWSRPFAAIFTFSLLLNFASFSQSPFLLSDSTAIYRLDNEVELFIDSTSQLSFEEIISPDIQKQFKRNYGNLSFGYLTLPIWLKLTTTTKSPSAQWYLEIPAPFLEYVDCYQQDKNKQWQVLHSGYYVRQSEKKIPHTGHAFPIGFNGELKSTVFVKISGQSPKSFPVLVMAKETWQEKIRWEDVGYGVFFGILLVMFFYNLFIFLSLRLTNYLLYICTIVCTFLILSSAAGYSSRFLWPENPELNFYAGRLTLPILTTFISLFSIRFLRVKEYSAFMYYMLIGLIPLSVLALILVVTKTLPSAGNNLVSFAVILHLTTGIICRVKGNKTATFYIAAWSIYMIGGLLLTFRNSGVFSFNFWTTHFVEIGAALETVIIALALADQYRRLRKEKEAAQLLALKIQTEAKEKLETKVKERTLELHKMLDTNQEQTKIIENKNIELDSFFYRISHDLRGPIASLIGLSTLANREVKDERAHYYLEKQQQQIERLNNVINGLIKLTKLQNSEIEKQEIDFNTLIDGCIASANELPNFQKVTFRKNLQAGIEFSSEWTLLNAIFQNLIENTIKYSRGNAPLVNINVFRQENSIVIQVEDNGVGIAQEHHTKIFDMFFRATNNSFGTGLGLYILKRSVDRLKGNIHVQSQEGVGSTFTVKIPAQ